MSSRKVLSAGTSVPVELGCVPSRQMDVFTNLEALTPVIQKIFKRFHHIGISIINSFSSPSPLPRGWGWGQKLQASHQGMVFLRPP